MTKHNKHIDKFKYPDIRTILINNKKIIYKNNKNRLQFLEEITIKIFKKKKTINKIAFNTGINILNIFYN